MKVDLLSAQCAHCIDSLCMVHADGEGDMEGEWPATPTAGY